LGSPCRGTERCLSGYPGNPERCFLKGAGQKTSLAVPKLLLAQADVEDKIDAYSAVNFN